MIYMITNINHGPMNVMNDTGLTSCKPCREGSPAWLIWGHCMKVAGKMGQDTDDQGRQRRQCREGIRGHKSGTMERDQGQ